MKAQQMRAIKNLGLIGRVEKQTPDTFFINTQDRWLTTTGGEKAERLRPIEEMGVIRRNDILTDYKGPAGNSDRQAGQAPTAFEPSKRHQMPAKDVPCSSAVGRGPSTDGDNFLRSHTNYANHRSTMKQPDTLRSGFGGAIGAVIAPLMDILRPSRKEETTNIMFEFMVRLHRLFPQSYVVNPNDTTNTTVKETTLYSPNFILIIKKKECMLIMLCLESKHREIQQVVVILVASGGAAAQYGDMSYDAAYRQHNNDIKSATIANRPNQGGTQMFNQQMNVNISKTRFRSL